MTIRTEALTATASLPSAGPVPALRFEQAFYLPSGRVFLLRTTGGYPIECTEMRDVSVEGKEHAEVRTTLDPHIIWRHLKPYADKWLPTVSTQRGCPHACRFCDVATLPFRVKLSATYLSENAEEIRSGAWFDEGARRGVRRFVVRRLVGPGSLRPELPAAARLVGSFEGQPVYEYAGLEMTLWDFALANLRLPAIHYWPDGRVAGSDAWDDLAFAAAARSDRGGVIAVPGGSNLTSSHSRRKAA